MAGDATEKVLDELNTLRIERQAVVTAREREMRESCPELKALDMQIARCCLRDKSPLPGLRLQREAIISQWLTERALPQNWLSPSPNCGTCKDTGYAEGKLCSCVRNEASRRLFSEAGLTANSPSFEKFDLSIFPEDRKVADGRTTVRERMAFLKELGLSYSDKYPELQKPNMLFTGKPGRGKTYLMDCIAGRVISRGYWVIRATAFGVNDIMAKALFDRADPDSLFECDLLVLDDIGSEPLLNKVTISSFFNLLNERSIKGKPFIISTNLTADEILKRYGDRIFSRMTDARSTRVIEFDGVDLRR
jgi:DNA replication protein DnaC